MIKEKELNVTNTPTLKISKIVKSFKDKKVLDSITFDVHQGEILALLGPSGCGKSTLLSIVAGIEKPDEGEIIWKGNSINDTPPHKRGFGLMFQDNALFPHMNVFENIAFGLEMSGVKRDSVHEIVSATLDLVSLQGLEDRNVNSLSGGEQQRVALARSLAPQPELLMLDEPLGSIDRALSERLMVELRTILRKIDQTAIYVTHDQEEAFAIADRIILMNQGKVEQIGPPEEIFRHPETLFTASFLGFTNFIPGLAKVQNGQCKVETPLGVFPLAKSLEGEVTVLIRPDSASLNTQPGIMIEGKLIEKTFRGNLCQALIYFNGFKLAFNFLSNSKLPDEGATINLILDPQEAISAYKI